jgi:hypothetical protein
LVSRIGKAIEAADELDVRWTAEALQEVGAQAQGFPYLLQVLAYATWEAAHPSAGDVLDADAVHAGLPLAVDQLTTMYAARWAAATALERADHGRDGEIRGRPR